MKGKKTKKRKSENEDSGQTRMSAPAEMLLPIPAGLRRLNPARPRFSHFLIFAFSLLLLASCQKKEESKEVKKPEIPLREGEVRDARWSKPVICAVADTLCSPVTTCPARGEECVLRAFRVPKDTLYVLTTSYFNGDTLNPSCRACATVYQDTAVIKNRVTTCPTGGAWVGMMNLKAGVDYLLAVSLQRCEKLDSCKCGDGAIAEAAVSLGRQF